MNSQSHWERIYAEKAPDAVSWYRPHLEKSLSLIEQFAPGKSAAIIDVGGGESTLVDDLLARGYENITVLDISQAAIDASRKRLGSASERISWLVADITRVELDACAYDVWHDRAVFHFLTEEGDRVAYVRQVAQNGLARGACDREYLRARRPHEMQWARCGSLRRRVTALGIWWTLPTVGEFGGTAPDSIRDGAAVSLLSLQGGVAASGAGEVAPVAMRWGRRLVLRRYFHNSDSLRCDAWACDRCAMLWSNQPG
jgi:SAM-dependent methyltransferase